VSTFAILMILVQAVLFIVWTALMFRTLFTIMRRARDDSKTALPGPLSTLKQWQIWLQSEGDRRSRFQLLVATALMFFAILLLFFTN
jgi:hypothetical protein